MVYRENMNAVRIWSLSIDTQISNFFLLKSDNGPEIITEYRTGYDVKKLFNSCYLLECRSSQTWVKSA